METFLIITLTIGIIILSIFIIMLNDEDKEVPNAICCGMIILFMLFLIAAATELSNKNIVVRTLNGEVQYDTIALNKNGKLLEIKLK